MVPARSLQLVRDAHATPCAAAAAAAGHQLGVTTAPRPSRYMAQEPVDQHHHHNEPSSKPPPPPQPDHGHGAAEPRPAGSHPQEAAGTSGGGSSGNGAGDWLRLGLAPATTPGAAVFAGPPPPRTATTAPAPPAAFLHHGIPQAASIPLPVPRAGPPWLPPWSPAPPPPPLLPFGHHHRAFYTPGAGAAASAGLDAIRVVLPPSAVAAPAAGVWFLLQAAPHQGREPFLPQIPRCYLRIKDGTVTIRLLTKYLAAKLGLEDESEVEITCRGRPLSALLTLQQVRDGIWWQGDAAVSPSVPPDLSAANHLMVLQYGRRPS
ncbi:hypothetical protein BS78_06G074600 [Paspalum vaginatum]|nr:hypothetical protein BS78_06G074600 [Paspalum vaginatum]